jgi:hypothetical protein
MKNIFILIIALVVVFFSCKKRDKNSTHCFVCINYDSTVSSFAGTSKATAGTDTLCGVTDIGIDYYMRTHTALRDTLYHRHDSLTIKYRRIGDCELK